MSAGSDDTPGGYRRTEQRPYRREEDRGYGRTDRGAYVREDRGELERDDRGAYRPSEKGAYQRARSDVYESGFERPTELPYGRESYRRHPLAEGELGIDFSFLENAPELLERYVLSIALGPPVALNRTRRQKIRERRKAKLHRKRKED